MTQAVSNTTQPQFRNNSFEQVKAILEDGVAEGVFPSAALEVAHMGRKVFSGAAGSLPASEGRSVPATVDTVYDIDSLTSVVCTIPLILKLAALGSIDLNARVSRYVHGFGVFGKSPITVRQLIENTSGLNHYVPFFTELDKTGMGGKLISVATRSFSQNVCTAINRSQLKSKPGSSHHYSEVGMILLGQIIESITGTTLDKVLWRELSGPLALTSTSFIDLSLLQRGKYAPDKTRIAPTLDCAWRGRELCGEVRDENAWMMGGVSGHAGLYSSAQDLTKFANMLLSVCHGRASFLPPELLHYAFSPVKGFADGLCAGWSQSKGALGTEIKGGSPLISVGKTGCAYLLDLQNEISIVLLSNKTYPSGGNKKLQQYLPKFFQEIYKALSS